MVNFKNTEEYKEKLKELKLSEASKERIAKELSDYADFHPVRILDESRSTEQVSQAITWNTAFFSRFSNRKIMPIYAIAAVLMLGTGTSMAAQGSVPGDLLYPIKTGVNEEIRSALAFSADAEARLQAELLEERIKEAEELKNEGRLEGELAVRIRQNVENQADRAEAEAEESGSETQAETSNRVALSLDRFNAAVSSEGLLAISHDDGDQTTGAKTESDVAVSSSLALEPVSVEFLFDQTKARIEALRDVTERHRSEISADVYAEYQARLDEAVELQAQATAQANEMNARQILLEAADLLGEIESDISSRGTVTIDTDTGFILDIDFSKKPNLDRGNIEPSAGSGADGSVGADAVIEVSEDIVETAREADASLRETIELSF